MMMVDGPEFAIHTLTGSLARANFGYKLSHNQFGGGVSVDLSELQALADSGKKVELLQAIAAKLLPEGRLTDEEIAIALPALQSTSYTPTIMRFAIQIVITTRFQVQP